MNNIEKIPFSIRQFLRLNWSVLAINYSGSIGSGADVSGRLYNFGPKTAFQRDAAAVFEYLKSSSQNKEKIVIYGESLGALPAVSLGDIFNDPKEIILVAPFLKHQSPSAWIDEKSEANYLSGSVNIEYQKKFERYFLGEYFDNDQAAILSMKKTDMRTLVIFAKNDRMSLIEHMPTSWKNGNLTIDTVPGGHEFSTAQPDTWKIINDWMNK